MCRPAHLVHVCCCSTAAALCAHKPWACCAEQLRHRMRVLENWLTMVLLACLCLVHLLNKNLWGRLVLRPGPSCVVLLEQRRANDPQGPQCRVLVERHKCGHAQFLAGQQLPQLAQRNSLQRSPQVETISQMELLDHPAPRTLVWQGFKGLSVHLGLRLATPTAKRCPWSPMPWRPRVPGRLRPGRKSDLHHVRGAGQGHAEAAKAKLYSGQLIQV
mmetsp:Transcript_138957/g.387530  ORF Transcript_138957/g.387530 Transcript_138957/m.387530 type:complete len:216 (+) Transcript_138957:228-875(+)